MKCKFKFKNGKSCGYIAEGGNFCYVHNPKIIPLFFIKNKKPYARNDSITDLSEREAQKYVDGGVAVRIDYKMRIQIEKTLASCLREAIAAMLKGAKEAIAKKDDNWIVKFFGKSLNPVTGKVRKFISDDGFSKKEQKYLKDLVSKINKRKRGKTKN